MMGTKAAPDFAQIDAYVNAQMQDARIPGLALGIIHGDQVAHLHGFGAADSTGRAVTPQTPFLLGSTTKSFTALAIMQLVEAGKIELDAPVQRYLPWFRVADPVASAHITVRHLLTQVSGLSTSVGLQMFTDSPAETPEQYVRNLSTVTLTKASWRHIPVLQRQLRHSRPHCAGRLRSAVRDLSATACAGSLADAAEFRVARAGQASRARTGASIVVWLSCSHRPAAPSGCFRSRLPDI